MLREGHESDLTPAERRVHGVIFVLAAIPTGFLVMFLPLHLSPGIYDQAALGPLATLGIGLLHFLVLGATSVAVGNLAAGWAIRLRRRRGLRD